MTSCKVSEAKPGFLRLEGEGFTIDMSYNGKAVKPEIEYIPVTDRALKRYWPNGVTRIKFVYLNPGLKGGMTLTLKPGKPSVTLTTVTKDTISSTAAPFHSHPHEQISYISEGELFLRSEFLKSK